MDKVQKIREEIEKRYEYWREKESNSHSIESEIRMFECQKFLLLLNSLKVKKVDLEKDVRQILSLYYEGIKYYDGIIKKKGKKMEVLIWQ